MLFLETQHVFDLLVGQRRLPLAHLPRDLGVRRRLGQELLRRHRGGDGVVGGVEDLEPQPVPPDAEVADLAEVARVDVAPRVAAAGLGLPDVAGEVARVLVRLDDVADAQGVDVGAAEAAREAPRHPLAAQLGQGVRVHGVDVVVLGEREVVVGDVGALGEADAVRRLAGRNHDLGHAQLARGLDDVVGRRHVAAPRLVVGHQQDARVRGEVDDDVGRRRHPAVVKAAEAEVRRQRVEDLPGVGQVRLERQDVRVKPVAVRVRQRVQVEVQDLVAAPEQLRDHMTPGFPATPREHDPLALSYHGGSQF